MGNFKFASQLWPNVFMCSWRSFSAFAGAVYIDMYVPFNAYFKRLHLFVAHPVFYNLPIPKTIKPTI